MNIIFLCRSHIAHRRAERGFALISAIFILVVLSVLGVATVTLSVSQQRGAVIDLQGTRAYQAAKAGLEWGMYQVNNSIAATLNTNQQTLLTASLSTLNARTCPGGTGTYNSFAMPAAASTLSAFTVTVSCTMITDPSNGLYVYQINAVACNVPTSGWTATSQACPGILGINYVERYMRVFM